MKLHDVQARLITFLNKKGGDIDNFSLREIGEQIGVGKKPQIVAHHLHQLEKKGFIRRDQSNLKKYNVLKIPTSDVVYINLYKSAECGPEGLLGEDTIVDKIPLSSRTFGISNPDDYFLIKARGKSMEPMIRDGDLILAKVQQNVENGSVAVVVHDSMPKIKKIIKDNNGKGFYSLVSLNPDYSKEDVFETDENLRIVGLVKGIIRLPTRE